MNDADVRQQDVDCGDVRLHVAEAGDSSSPALVLIHGIWDRWEAWQAVIPDLATRYHLIIPELRGHGQSDKPASGYELSDYAGDIRALLARLEIPQSFVCGHSLGALVTIELAAGHDSNHVPGAILVDPPLRITPDAAASFNILLHVKHGSEEETYAAVSEIYAERGESEWGRITEWLRGTADGPWEWIIKAGNQNASYLPLLAQVDTPALLLQADPSVDGALLDEDAKSARQLKPDIAFQRFDATAHGIHQQRPAEFCQVVFAFLDTIRKQ